jgi:hypothetical protein
LADGWLGLVWGELLAVRVSQAGELPCPSASTHAHLRSAHTGYGSSHIGLGSISKHGDPVGAGLQRQHAKPTRLRNEANPCCESETHSLRCHLTPPVMTRDATVHTVGTHPRKSYLILHYTFVQKDVCACVQCAGPLPRGRVWRVLGRTCLHGLPGTLPPTVDPSRAALTPPPPGPNGTLRVAKEF